MRVIMLDIDGVFNNSQSDTMYWRRAGKKCVFLNETMFDPICCSNLQSLLETYPDLKVVLSSTWRVTRDLKYLEQVFQKFWGVEDLEFIDKTPRMNRARGTEIHWWLKENWVKHSITDMLILDDDCDMDMFKDTPFFLHIDNNVGFDYYAMKKAEEFFKTDHQELLRSIVYGDEDNNQVVS